MRPLARNGAAAALQNGVVVPSGASRGSRARSGDSTASCRSRTRLHNPGGSVMRDSTVPPRPRAADMTKRWEDSLSMARMWLLPAQHDGGGWGGDVGVTSTIEETALALEALAESVASFVDGDLPAACQDLERAIARGVRWLHRATAGGTRFPTSPIGLYFAKLWYSEKLYPVLFTVAALQRISRLSSGMVSDSFPKTQGVPAT